MKKLFIKIGGIIAIFSIVFPACQKGNDGKSKTQLLTGMEWKLSKSEGRLNSNPFTDHYPSLPSCTQDDKYKFNTDNTYVLSEGVSKCNTTDPDIIASGIWHFTQNETKIQIDGTEYTIDQLNGSSFIISNSYYSNPDSNFYRYTFSH